MPELTNASIQQHAAKWSLTNTVLPAYDYLAVAAATRKSPIWLHFGAGNIFRGFIAGLQQDLLNRGLTSKGIIAAETFDTEILDRIYTPFDCLTLMVTLNSDGTTSREIISSIAEAVKATCPNGLQRLFEIAGNPSLQMISYTITEKGYALFQTDGNLLPTAQSDMEKGPDGTLCHAMGITAALLYRRWKAGGFPLSVVSMDNCSRNGEKLRSGVLSIVKAWRERDLVPAEFQQYVEDESRVAFPWTMIDKITPRPHSAVEKGLEADGIVNMKPIITEKGTYIAPFVNAERPQYLVMEDAFPNGRPPLEQAGVYLTDRATVNKTERMKVTTCLNPLHTAMSVYGCLLGYTLICDEMKDPEIVALIRRLGYQEGLPVVVNPGVLNPKAFLDEVVEQRLPNPFMPDAPQRIATDTSQKVGIRFGETIKSYLEQGRDLNSLIAIPLAIAGWMRYLLAVDDQGAPMEVSSDPLLAELQMHLKGILVGHPETYHGQLRSILCNASIFGLDLCATPLADQIETMFLEELAGFGVIRGVLKKYLKS